jgi:glucan endo-1,3-beta-D-glucosidase
MIQAGTTNTPTGAIPAAIETKTTLLLGLWASAGSGIFNNEVAALTSAISKYGTNFTSIIAGIVVGSEDLYRNSPIGIEKKAGIGANPSDVINYIGQVRSAIANTPASGAPVGHVDTWTVWVNSSNNAVISACDFIGMDSYPYFENDVANSIDVAYNVFFQTFNNTKAAVGNKPVWITETGWPVSGLTNNLAVASIQNAQTYWDKVGCVLFGNINTWWFTLQDAYPTTPTPSFGIVGSQLSTTPLFNLTCPAVGPNNPPPASSSSVSNPSTKATSSTFTSFTSSNTGTILPTVSTSSASGMKLTPQF